MFSASTHTFSLLENSKWELYVESTSMDCFQCHAFFLKVSNLHGKGRC